MSLPFKKPDDIGGAIYGSQIGVYIFLVNDELFRTPRILKSLAVEVLGDFFLPIQWNVGTGISCFFSWPPRYDSPKLGKLAGIWGQLT